MRRLSILLRISLVFIYCTSFSQCANAVSGINEDPVCDTVRELLDADRLAEIEVPLAELDIDVDRDGKSEKIEKRFLGAAPVLNLLAVHEDGKVGLVGICSGCASMTTRDIKALKIDGKLYLLSVEPNWSSYAKDEIPFFIFIHVDR